ncbi:hypothetical protein PTKIN_Ptkin13bG0006400 [Pterospermum kingtungense]
MGAIETRLQDQYVPVVKAPVTVREPSCYLHQSIEALIVALAMITIISVIARIIARLCYGRHFGENGENSFEGWIENKCRSCIENIIEL